MTEYRDSVLKECEHMSNRWSEALQDLCLKGFETHEQNRRDETDTTRRKHDEQVGEDKVDYAQRGRSTLDLVSNIFILIICSQEKYYLLIWYHTDETTVWKISYLDFMTHRRDNCVKDPTCCSEALEKEFSTTLWAVSQIVYHGNYV